MRVIVTGFGAFAGVSQNPTTEVACKLPEFADAHPCPAVTGMDCQVIRTSAADATAAIENIRALVGGGVSDGTPSAHTLVLHLGVHASATQFAIESTAYNEADFRIPDENGYAPRHTPIDHTKELGAPLRTRLPVPALVDSMLAKGFPCQASTDPGRFVCNYTYFASLNAFGSRHDVVRAVAKATSALLAAPHPAPPSCSARSLCTCRRWRASRCFGSCSLCGR